VEPLYTAAQLEEVRAYHAPVYTSAALELVLAPLLLIGAARFLTRPVHRLASRWGKSLEVPALERAWRGKGWATAVLFALLYFGFFALVNLPQEVWFGWVREREFGMSRESLGTFLFDGLKAKLILVVSVSALGFGLFGLARRTRHWWWMLALATSAAMVVSIAVDPYRSRLSYDQEPLPVGALRSRLTAMLDTASIPFGEIYVVKTGARSVRVQAAFAGTGPTRSILLTDTLLEQMTEAEVVAAVAHEAGHVSESRWLGRVLSPLAVFALLAYVEWLFRRSAQRGWFGITERGDVRVLPLLLLTFDLAVTLVTPGSAAVSRSRESAADLFALELTRDGAALSSLLVKVGRINKVDPDPPRWYVLSGVSHPTIVERVEAIRLAQKNATPPPTTPVTEGTSAQQAPGVTR
jgi:STE24 endopeptidase